MPTDLSNRILLARHLSRASLTDFSRLLSLSQPAVLARYENGSREPDREILLTICKKTEIELQWLTYGLGWTYQSGGSRLVQKAVLENIPLIEEVVIVSYEDGRFGKAIGFLAKTEHGSYTVGGGGARTGYLGGGPNVYRYILEAIKEARKERDIPVFKTDLKPGSVPLPTKQEQQIVLSSEGEFEWNKMNVAEFILHLKSVPLDIDKELKALRPDLYAKDAGKKKLKERPQCAADHLDSDKDLVEIVEVLHHDLPSAKEHILNMLRMMKREKG